MSGALEIVAVGARTPVGLTAAASAAAIRAGISGVREYPFVMADGEPALLASDRRLPATLTAADRMVSLGASALAEIAAAAGPAATHPGSLHVVLAIPELRPGFEPTDATTVERGLTEQLRLHWPHAKLGLAGRGHAGVALAVEQSLHAGQPKGEGPLTLVLGVDSYLQPETLLWLEKTRKLGKEARSGLIPGEAAGAVLLAPTGLRRQLRLPSLGRLHGVGTAHERLLPDSDTGSFGEGLTHALRKAMAGLKLPEDAADDVYLDINGERYRSEEWGFCAMRFSSAFRSLDYHAPAALWGDVGAATGALAIVLAVESWARGYARGARAVVMTGSLGGNRGAMVLDAVARQGRSPHKL